MVEYKLFEQTHYYNNSGFYKVYGIIVFENNKHVRTIPDISKNKVVVENIIEKFNTYKLELCHLSQAVEDYLYDLSVD